MEFLENLKFSLVKIAQFSRGDRISCEIVDHQLSWITTVHGGTEETHSRADSGSFFDRQDIIDALRHHEPVGEIHQRFFDRFTKLPNLRIAALTIENTEVLADILQ